MSLRLDATDRARLRDLKAAERAILAPAKLARKAEQKAERRAQPKREQRVHHDTGKQTRGRVIDKDHKGMIAGLFCLATAVREGREAYGVHVAHVRHSYPHPGWSNPGLQRKPDDWRTVPLAPHEHAAQHDMNEAAFYSALGIYPPDLCAALREVSPDLEAAKAVLRRFVVEARRGA